jgi:hypothetical protein
VHKLTHSQELQEAVRFLFHFTVIFCAVVVPHFIAAAVASLLGLS